MQSLPGLGLTDLYGRIRLIEAVDAVGNRAETGEKTEVFMFDGLAKGLTCLPLGPLAPRLWARRHVPRMNALHVEGIHKSVS